MNGFLALSIFNLNNNSDVRGGFGGGTEISLRGKSTYAPWVIPNDHNIEYILDNNQKRVPVAEISSPSEENSTTLTPSARDTREIASGFFPENKVRGTQSQRILTNFLFI